MKRKMTGYKLRTTYLEQILGGNDDMHTALSTDGRHLAHGIRFRTKSSDFDYGSWLQTVGEQVGAIGKGFDT